MTSVVEDGRLVVPMPLRGTACQAAGFSVPGDTHGLFAYLGKCLLAFQAD